MTRIVCVSDLHENLPTIEPCDLLLIAGDISFAFKGDLIAKQDFLVNEFRYWLEEVPAKRVCVVAGNHDQSIEQWGWPLYDLQPKVQYLEDSGIHLPQLGLTVWGTPWQPWFYDWAFNAPQHNGEVFLAEKFAMIPDDTDIVICHGPPRGYGDQIGDPNAPDRSGQPRAGSQAMTDRLRQIQPRLMVCGHIHSGYGRYRLHDVDGIWPMRTFVVNAALVNNQYQPVNSAHVVDLA